jgi:hypothetical protein
VVAVLQGKYITLASRSDFGPSLSAEQQQVNSLLVANALDIDISPKSQEMEALGPQSLGMVMAFMLSPDIAYQLQDFFT